MDKILKREHLNASYTGTSTVHFSGYLFGRLQSPQKFGFGFKENLEFPQPNVSSKFRNTGKLIPFVFGGTNISFKMQVKGRLAFS